MQSLNFFNFFPSTATQQQHHYQMLIVIKSFITMLSGQADLNAVGEMSEALVETPAFDLAAQHLKRDPDCAKLISDRYIPVDHDLDHLLTYPQESLGYIYAKTVKSQGFNPNLHAGMTPASDAHYVELRLSQTHDIWHLITGFDTSEIGEIGLQAFHLTQFPYPLGASLVASSLMSSTLLAPEILPQLIAAIAQGLQMGKIAKSLFAQKWEENWEKPLTQWQVELNLHPLPSH